MYFKEKSEEVLASNKSVDDELVEGNQVLSGINGLINDMNSMLNKVAMLYSNTLDFKNDLSKKNDIAKGAITHHDVQSITKLMSHDVNLYINKMKNTANKLRKSHLQLENKVNVLLSNGDMDKEYKSAFSKSFFYKTMNLYIDKYAEEKINSGVFLITIDKATSKSSTFMKKTHKDMLEKIYSELRYLDVVARISDRIFAVLIADVSRENFEFILKAIIKKIKTKDLEQLVSASMIGEFESSDTIMKMTENNLSKVRYLKDDYIFS